MQRYKCIPLIFTQGLKDNRKGPRCENSNYQQVIKQNHARREHHATLPIQSKVYKDMSYDRTWQDKIEQSIFNVERHGEV